MRTSQVGLAIALGAAVAAGPGAQAASTGQVLAASKLTTLDGRAEPVVDRTAGATVLLFFRTGQDRSVEALRGVGACEPTLPAEGVRIVGVVSDQEEVEGVRAALAAAGSRLTVLVDAGDAVYAEVGIRTHPTLATVDRTRRVVAVDAWHQTGGCEVLRARVRRVLGQGSDAEVAAALAPAASGLPGEDARGVAARHVRLGRKLLATGSYADAHANARRSLELAPSAAAWALEGDVFAAEGRCADATRAYEAALALGPGDAAAVAGRAACAKVAP